MGQSEALFDFAVHECSHANIIEDVEWTLYAKLAIHHAILAEARIILVVSETTSSDRNSNHSCLHFNAIKSEEVKQMKVQ